MRSKTHGPRYQSSNGVTIDVRAMCRTARLEGKVEISSSSRTWRLDGCIWELELDWIMAKKIPHKSNRKGFVGTITILIPAIYSLMGELCYLNDLDILGSKHDRYQYSWD